MIRRFPYLAVAALSVAALMLFSFGVASAAPTHPATGSTSLTVTVGTALGFTLSTDELTPGANITLTIVQTSDEVAHTFTLSNVAGQTFPTTDTTNDLLTFLATHPPLVNISIPGTQGTFTSTFTAPPYGEYAYFCLIPGHFPQMYGILGSGEPGSSVSVDDGPGAVVFYIGGSVAALVVVAIVLGFVVGKRRGSHDEMPPERLGYPEPAGVDAPKSPHH